MYKLKRILVNRKKDVSFWSKNKILATIAKAPIKATTSLGEMLCENDKKTAPAIRHIDIVRKLKNQYTFLSSSVGKHISSNIWMIALSCAATSAPFSSSLSTSALGPFDPMVLFDTGTGWDWIWWERNARDASMYAERMRNMMSNNGAHLENSEKRWNIECKIS